MGSVHGPTSWAVFRPRKLGRFPTQEIGPFLDQEDAVLAQKVGSFSDPETWVVSWPSCCGSGSESWIVFHTRTLGRFLIERVQFCIRKVGRFGKRTWAIFLAEPMQFLDQKTDSFSGSEVRAISWSSTRNSSRENRYGDSVPHRAAPSSIRENGALLQNVCVYCGRAVGCLRTGHDARDTKNWWLGCLNAEITARGEAARAKPTKQARLCAAEAPIKKGITFRPEKLGRFRFGLLPTLYVFQRQAVSRQ